MAEEQQDDVIYDYGRRYQFTLKGVYPLLMHKDDIGSADALIAWRTDSANKDVSVKGDDRSPAWTWQTYLYHDGEVVAMPQENIMAAIRTAGAQINLKGTTTFKAKTQSGLFIDGEFCEFTTGGRQVRMDDILKFKNAKFSEHVQRSRELGFDLHVKRARPSGASGSKHIRVRPIFKDWQIRGVIEVGDPAITDDILKELFDKAGRYAGLCDWRPSSKKSPGPYGTFTSTVIRV